MDQIGHLEWLVVRPEHNVRDLPQPVGQPSEKRIGTEQCRLLDMIWEYRSEERLNAETRGSHTNKPMVPFRLDEGPDPDDGVHVVILDHLEELDHVVPPLEVELQARKGADRSISHV